MLLASALSLCWTTNAQSVQLLHFSCVSGFELFPIKVFWVSHKTNASPPKQRPVGMLPVGWCYWCCALGVVGGLSASAIFRAAT